MLEDANILKIQQSDMNYDRVRKHPTSFFAQIGVKVDLLTKFRCFKRRVTNISGGTIQT